jgi:hypothetical protein
VVLRELAAAAGDDEVGEDDTWAYAWMLLEIAKSIMLTRTENSAKIKIVLFMLNYIDALLLFI